MRRTRKAAGPAAEAEAMRVRILRSRDFTPPEARRTLWALVVGQERSFRRIHAEQLIAEGDAEAIPTPPRPVADPEA